MKEQFFSFIQYLLPHHLISRAAHAFVESTHPKLKNTLINSAIKRYQVDLSEAEREHPEEYHHFNDFFTRALKPNKRPMPDDKQLIVSPADGEISQIGDIEYGRIFQAKGHDYSLTELIGGDSDLSREFMGGQFASIYLSPRDYHRVHTPFNGTLRQMIHVPGRLFSVNTATAENIPNLFARNERVVCIYDTDHGPMAVIMVGAMIVASIETVWAGVVTPQRKQVRTYHYPQEQQSVKLSRGDEMGRFKMGSTVIVLFSEGQTRWLDHLQSGDNIKMGEALAQPA